MEIRLKLSGFNALAFLLMTLSAILFFVSLESPFWAEVDHNLVGGSLTSVGVWNVHSLVVNLPLVGISTSMPIVGEQVHVHVLTGI